jgi:hypothetical protein
MSRKFRMIVMGAAAVHVAAFIATWLWTGDWSSALLASLLLFVFLTGFPLMVFASIDEPDQPESGRQ